MRIEFVIHGTPRPAGSRRPIAIRNGAGVVVAVRSIDAAGKKGADWRASVQAVAREALTGELMRGPLQVVFNFYAPRPKGHFHTSLKNLGKLKADAPAFPTGRPDVLKLARHIEDSCTGILWHDDAQIVSEHLSKSYGEPARCEVSIWTINQENEQ